MWCGPNQLDSIQKQRKGTMMADASFSLSPSSPSLSVSLSPIFEAAALAAQRPPRSGPGPDSGTKADSTSQRWYSLV